MDVELDDDIMSFKNVISDNNEINGNKLHQQFTKELIKSLNKKQTKKEKEDLLFKQLTMMNDIPLDKDGVKSAQNINLPLAFLHDGYKQRQREVVHLLKNKVEPTLPIHKQISRTYKKQLQNKLIATHDKDFIETRNKMIKN